MALAGWYPDPGGSRGRYRYWDGAQWSATTTADPSDPPPQAGPPPPRRRRGALIAVVAAVLVAILGVAVVLGLRSGDRATDPLPQPSVTAPDDRSPSAPPSSSSPTPSATPSPSPSSPPPTPSAGGPCPAGDPGARQPHPTDGRVHGGGLSFPRQPGWTGSAMKYGLSWAYDVDGQDTEVEPQWFAMFAVGALFTGDGFDSPEQAANAVMACTATSDFYTGYLAREDVSFEAVAVDGHPGWLVRSRILVDSPRTDLPGDLVQVVVVDLGSPESLAMFWAAVPMDDAAYEAQLDAVTAQLRAD